MVSFQVKGIPTDRRTRTSRRGSAASAGARHRAPAPEGGDQSRRRLPRGLYPLSALLMLPALIAGGVYLARSPAASIAAHTTGTTTTQQATGACGSAAGAPCAESPAYISTASPADIGTATSPLAPRASGSRARHPGPQPFTSTSTGSSSPTGSSHPAGHTPTPASTHPMSPTRIAPTRKASASASSPTQSTTRPTVQPSASASQGSPASTAAAAVLTLINQARSAAGLAPLTITTGLENSSSAHNSVMAAGCGLSHQCSGEADLGARETAAGVHWTAAGENIGDGSRVANTTAAITQLVVTLTQDMLNEQPPDDGHRLNILSTSFTHIGIAVLRGGSGTVWLTQDFSS